jgi:hypothetical protein
MERIILNSGLSGFLLVDAVTEVDAQRIAGWKEFAGAPPYLGIESLAQLGALHVRYLTGFERHAFLLTIKRCLPASKEALNGRYRLCGKLTGRAASAFSYRLEAALGDETEIQGDFLFAVVEYDTSFRRDILRSHYEKVYSCLTSASTRNC